MRYALNAIAKESPAWLNQMFREEWLHRYYLRGGNVRIPHSAVARQDFAETIGRDAHALLEAVYQWSDLLVDREIEALEILRRVLIQQFYVDERGVHWRTEAEGTPPSVIFINSPYDVEAHYGKKRHLQWTGYKVYLTETCDEDLPRLLTNVAVSSAPVADFHLTELIHGSLKKKGLLPTQHLAETGFVDVELMLAAKNQYQIDLLGPSHLDQQWQSRHNPKFCGENFLIQWPQKKAVCPAGKTSVSWSEAKTATAKQVVKIKFSMKDCQLCLFRADCTKSRRARRTLTILPEEQYESRRKIRDREKTEEYRKEYARRSGIEGTISQATRGVGMRRSRYIGEAKTQMQELISAIGINLVRITNWLREVPVAKTREPLFAKVMRGQSWQN
jgi:transposase